MLNKNKRWPFCASNTKICCLSIISQVPYMYPFSLMSTIYAWRLLLSLFTDDEWEDAKMKHWVQEMRSQGSNESLVHTTR